MGTLVLSTYFESVAKVGELRGSELNRSCTNQGARKAVRVAETFARGKQLRCERSRAHNSVGRCWFYLRALALFKCNIFRIEKAKRRKFFDERGTVELLAAHGTRGQVQLGQAWQLRDFL